MGKSIEVVWKLILDQQTAKEGEAGLAKLSEEAGRFGEQLNKIARQKYLEDLAKDMGKVALETENAEQAAIDFNKRLQEIGATEDEIKGLAKTFSDVQSAKDTESGTGGGGGLKASGLLEKFSGVGRMAGINTEQIAGIVKATEGLKELAGAAGVVGTASEAAGVAGAAAAPGLLASAAGLAAMLVPLLPLVIAIGAVVAVLAALKSADDQRAKDLKEQVELERSISDQIAAGATKEDIQDQIEALKERSELEQGTLERGKKAYDDYMESVRNSFGGLGRLLEPFVRLFGSYEEQLASNVNDSQKLIDDNTKKEEAYQDALDRGDTAKNDAKKREEELAEARKKAADDSAKATEKAQHDQEEAQRKQQADQDKAQAEQQRKADEAQRKAEERAKKEYETQRKYTDTLVDIARKGRDDAIKAMTDYQRKTRDNTRAFWQDIGDLSRDFQASEYEERLKRHEDEVNDAIQQTRTLERIRDGALRDEQDALRSRDFLSATKIREAANRQIEDENKAALDARADTLRAQEAEDAQQLRALDKSRRDRLEALNRANAEAKLSYTRALIDQRDSQKIAAREAAIARDRELRNAADTARALLGIQQQSSQAQIQLAQSTLNSLKGMGNTTVNNNGNTLNGGLHFNLGGASSMSGTPLTGQILTTLRTVGLG